jgi:hypothetical protein
MTLIKEVLKSLVLPEKRLAMMDHCAIMHRLDRTHQTHYVVICNEHEAGQDELTIHDFFESTAGQMWRDESRVQRAQYYIKWLAVQHLSSLSNQQLVRRQVDGMSDDNEEDRQRYLNSVRHAMVRINPYQVRLFVAMLFGMCTVDQIMNACDNDRVYDEQLGKTKNVWAKPFKMKLHFMHLSDMSKPHRVKQSWTWPKFAPPSAMQWLCSLLQLTDAECAWTQDMMAGVQCFEQGEGEKMSFWDFWRDKERFCVLEEYATRARAKKARKLLLERGTCNVSNS